MRSRRARQSSRGRLPQASAAPTRSAVRRSRHRQHGSAACAAEARSVVAQSVLANDTPSIWASGGRGATRLTTSAAALIIILHSLANRPDRGQQRRSEVPVTWPGQSIQANSALMGIRNYQYGKIGSRERMHADTRITTDPTNSTVGPPSSQQSSITLISHNLSREQHAILANRPNARCRACALKLAPVASTTVVDVDGVALRATRARGKQRATACHWWPRLAKQG